MKNLKYFLLFICVSIAIASQKGNKKKILCYFANWLAHGEGTFLGSDIDPFACTHILYAFAGINDNGSFQILDRSTDFDLYQIANVTALKTVNKDLKVLIAIGGWNEGSVKYSAMANDSARRALFINTTVQALLENGFDGMDLDWEYPARNGGDELNDRANFVTLLKELREAFDKHNFILSAAVAPAGDFVNISYDVPALSKYLDMINLMEYDYHGTWDGFTGINSPLFESPTDITPTQQEWNINASITKWISLGADPKKLILGIPFYGHSYKLDNASDVSIGSLSSEPGPPGHYLKEPGSLGYYEICEYILQGNWNIVWDQFSLTPYMYKDGIWVSYDNDNSIKLKTSYAINKDLGGVMVWNLGMDDFHGHCGEKNILMKSIHEAMGLPN